MVTISGSAPQTWLLVMGWLVATAAMCIGVGVLFPGAKRSAGADPWRAFWAGLIVTMPLAAAWHLVLPLNGGAATALAGVALVGWVKHGRALFLGARRLVRARPVSVAAFALLWVALPWLALQPLTCTDSGFYYVAAVEWHRALPQVPGLQATNPLSVMNSSAFHLIALSGVGPFAGLGHVTFNVTLTWWGLATGIGGLEGLSRRWRLTDFVSVLAMVPAFDLLPSNRLSCPTADVGVAWLGMALVTLALGPARRSALALVLLAPMFKLSLALTCIPLALVIATRPPAARRLAASFWAVKVAAVGWLPVLAGNVVTSGYPLYPLAVAGLPFDWRLPQPLVEEVAHVIRSYAAHDGIAGHAPAVERFARLLLHNREVLFPLLLAAIGTALTMLRAVRAKGARLQAGGIVVAAALGWSLWFVSAPDPRFAGAMLWMTGALLSGFGAMGAPQSPPLPRTMRVLLVLTMALLVLGDVPVMRFPRSVTSTIPRLPSNLEEHWVTLSDGSRIIEGFPWPGGTPRCWSVPCAALYPSGLQRRDPHDLARGFRLPAEARLPPLTPQPRGGGSTLREAPRPSR